MTTELLEYVLTTQEALSCPRALTVALMARHGMWSAIAELDAKPEDYCDAETFFLATQATSFVSSLGTIPGSGPKDREAAAIAKWLDCERACARSNLRLSKYLYNEGDSPSDERVYSFLEVARKKILEMIGMRPPATWEGRFGPGATVSDKSALVTVPDKISSVPTFTSNALFYLVPWSGTKWAAHTASVEKTPQAVRGNVFFTVPKTAWIDRPCAKEPSLNGFYQLGLGRILKARLKYAGLDLFGGKIVHMRKAQEASASGRFATIDLSSASDTMCKALVKLLLPEAWYDALASLRSPTTKVAEKTFYLEKFSSMGNGFTFELETLVFTAICMACGPDLLPGVDLFVYGDDIIVPCEFADDVIAALKFFGFKPNPKKTFSKGPFRESCGGDFFNGVGVRPFSPDEVPSTPEQWIAFHNGVRRASLATTLDQNRVVVLGPPCPSRRRVLQRLTYKAERELPRLIRACRGPEVLGDLVLHKAEWNTRWRGQIGYIRVYRPLSPNRAVERGFADSAVLAAACYGAQADPPWRSVEGRFPLARGWAIRGSRGYKLGWVAYS